MSFEERIDKFSLRDIRTIIVQIVFNKYRNEGSGADAMNLRCINPWGRVDPQGELEGRNVSIR